MTDRNINWIKTEGSAIIHGLGAISSVLGAIIEESGAISSVLGAIIEKIGADYSVFGTNIEKVMQFLLILVQILIWRKFIAISCCLCNEI